MKTILTAGALALGLFGFSGKADAQFQTGYGSYYNPYTGNVVNQNTFAYPNTVQQVSNFYSPYSGNVGQRVYTADIFGNQSVRSFGYNPYYGGGYNRGYYANPYTNSFYRYRYRY